MTNCKELGIHALGDFESPRATPVTTSTTRCTHPKCSEKRLSFCIGRQTPTTLRGVAGITRRQRCKSAVIVRHGREALNSSTQQSKIQPVLLRVRLFSRGSIWPSASFPVSDLVAKGTQPGNYFSDAIMDPRVRCFRYCDNGRRGTSPPSAGVVPRRRNRSYPPSDTDRRHRDSPAP